MVDCKFSISGDSFLVANGSDQVKWYDRDGAEMYVYLLPLSTGRRRGGELTMSRSN